MKLSFLSRAKKQKEKNAIKDRRNTFKEVANLFNTLKKGCESDDEMRSRIELVKDRMPESFKSAKRKADLLHSKELLKMAKETSKENIETLKEFKKLGQKELEFQDDK